MFFLPTRQRPQGLKRFFEHYALTGSDSCGVVWLDADDSNLDEYKEIELPGNWQLLVRPRQESLGDIWAAFFAEFPNESWYGFVADDIIPLTRGWDKELIKAAGSDCLAYCDDGINGNKHASHPVVGGDLLRSITLPKTKRLYMDNALMDAAKRKGKLKYLTDVRMEHLHWTTGKRPRDANDDKSTGDKEIYEAWKKTFDKPVKVVCVDAGNYLERGAEYVNKLYDMVRRNVPDTFPGTFVCFSDSVGTDYSPGIDVQSLPKGIKGWWNKLYLFKSGLFNEGERIIYLDLDTIITGGLDDIIRYDGEFSCLKDFYHDRYAYGVMAWEADFGHGIWDSYVDAGYPTDMPFGDMDWINRYFSEIEYKPQILQELFPKQIVSYKVHARNFPPKGSRIVCFHGNPRPHEAGGWLEHIWKIGGGTTAELDVVCNVSDDKCIENIRASLKLGLPKLFMAEPHDKHAVIVGGGPSLKRSIDELRARSDHGQDIFATNGTYKYLFDNGLISDYHVMLDARPEMASMVPEYTNCFYASQCDPSVFEKAKENACKVTLWHHGADDTVNTVGKNTGEVFIGGSTWASSVGLKTIILAHILGYRHIHLYGFDSCYNDDSHHAYEQILNNNETILDVICNGRHFKVAPWMATQVEEFKEIVPQLVKEGCSISVHGDGLIPYVAEQMYIANFDKVSYNNQEERVYA